MTGKTGATSTHSVTTKKYALNFKQQKTNLNVERKKNTLLEQRLREMESALAMGGISSIRKETELITTYRKTPTRTIAITTPAVNQAHILAENTVTQLFLPPAPSNNSATAGSATMSVVGRWE
jgi:hypothetical protein